MDLNNPWFGGLKKVKYPACKMTYGIHDSLGFHLNYQRLQIWVISLQNLRVSENLQPPLPGFFWCGNRIFRREVHSFLLHTSKGVVSLKTSRIPRRHTPTQAQQFLYTQQRFNLRHFTAWRIEGLSPPLIVDHVSFLASGVSRLLHIHASFPWQIWYSSFSASL